MRERAWRRAAAIGRVRTVVVGSAAAGALALAGCDLGVTNPELIDEADLQIPEAVPATVNGARHAFSLATTINGAGGVYSASAALTDELTHVGSWIPPREISDGTPGNESPENQSHWGLTSRARWQAEDAIAKVTDLVDDPGSDEWVAMATLYAGFASRLQGDLFCDAVIDGGERQDPGVFHHRAAGHFEDAIQIAQAGGHGELLDAAYAGLAQALMQLGDWSAATDAAGQVPLDFVYAHPHSDNTGSESNGVFEWSALSSGQYSVWATPFAEWGTDLSGELETEGDPRATFMHRDEMGGGSPDRPFWFAQKYTSRNDDIPIAKGTEMRLIEAEAALHAGDVPGALERINEARAHHGLDDATAEDPSEAWQLLMKERGLELWLEGRRLGDLRRWADDPSTRELITSEAWRQGEELRPVLDADPFCLRVSTQEIFSNENITEGDVR